MVITYSIFLQSLDLQSSLVLNFEGTTLVLVLGPRLSFGWYEADIYTLPLRFIFSLNNPLNIYTLFFVKIRI